MPPYSVHGLNILAWFPLHQVCAIVTFEFESNLGVRAMDLKDALVKRKIAASPSSNLTLVYTPYDLYGLIILT